MTLREKKALLLETSKKMNFALAKRKFQKAKALLKLSNSIRESLGQPPMRLKNLEARFNGSFISK